MSLLTRTDVTAVKLFQHYILAGIGSTLEVFTRKSGSFVQRFSALRGQKIYGIVPSLNNTKLLIFGGKQFAVLIIKRHIVDKAADIVICHCVEPIISDDWLHSGIWINENMVAFLTAHNVVQIWDVEGQSIDKQFVSPDNSILYCGLLIPIKDDILIFSGTVFSEIIINCCGDNKPLHYLRGHKGVIFSITCEPHKGVIVTTSDDRSVRIWNIKSLPNLEYKYKDYWQNAEINCTHELYGHSARVMRNSITNEYIISIGEDAGICFWNHGGKLLRKILSHQNSCIWSLDADNEILVTGGSDSGVILHPLSLLTDYSINQIVDIDASTPKKVEFTARGNLVVMNEGNDLIYYNLNSRSYVVHKLNHKSTYQLLSLSPCKQLIAVADMTGRLSVFMENCKGDPEIKNVVAKELHLGKILSMQWATNRHLVICSDNGDITLLASKEYDAEIFASFILPQCKERWLTSTTLSSNKEMLIVSDRCGRMHIYLRGNSSPIKTFDKVHGRYGATTITIRENKIITTGRDGTIKYFSINKDNTNKIKYMSTRDLEFQWVEKFLDKNENYVCGFQERTFVVYDIKNNMKILDVNCGGGHRSWDAIRYFDNVDNNYEECISLTYIKNSKIHLDTFRLNKIVSRNIIHGTHSKEINCLKAYSYDEDKGIVFYICGGEDTTLRISSSSQNSLKSRFRDEVIFKQLSSVRSLRILQLEPNKLLIVSAGGRAQICAKIITINNANDSFDICSEELVDYLIKGTDKERKGNRNWKNCLIDFDPETRIMDQDIIKIDDNFLVFCGCSDGVLRVFKLENKDTVYFKPIQHIKYHKTCILKTHIFQFINDYVLITCTTRGEITFWNIDTSYIEPVNNPFYNMKTNQSGINCIDVKSIDCTRILLATAGDDNAIHLNVIGLESNDLKSMKVIHNWFSDRYHCSQITGLQLIDDLMLTTSVDQRITLFKLSVTNKIYCEFISQSFSDISDIQGIDVLNISKDVIKVCVFGKGIEVLQISREVTT